MRGSNCRPRTSEQWRSIASNDDAITPLFTRFFHRRGVMEDDGGEKIGDPSRIRTCNPRSRNPLLYPVELWDRRRTYNIANMKNPLSRQVRSEPFFAIPRQSCSADHCFRSATPARL